MATKFGIGQIGNTTPKWAQVSFRIFFYATGIATVILDIYTEIPSDIKLMINSEVIKANLLVHAISKMFGINVTQYEVKTDVPNDQALQTK
jgi:hypothetical protein